MNVKIGSPRFPRTRGGSRNTSQTRVLGVEGQSTEGWDMASAYVLCPPALTGPDLQRERAEVTEESDEMETQEV